MHQVIFLAKSNFMVEERRSCTIKCISVNFGHNVTNTVTRDGKVKMKIKVADSTLMKTFEETDLLSNVLDYVKQVMSWSGEYLLWD